tara:strand:- start:179 stop:433 length:255 start_codon:yes stop_codon:yes gene_type:complete
MSKSKFVIDKLVKLFEQGVISYNDLSSEVMNIMKSKRDELVFKMKLTGKEETDILNLRIEKLEKKLKKLENNLQKKKSKKAIKS